MEKYRGNFCCTPRFVTTFRADDDEIDFSQINTINVLPAYYFRFHFNIILNPKFVLKAVPLQAWTGPEGSRNLRSTDFVTTA